MDVVGSALTALSDKEVNDLTEQEYTDAVNSTLLLDPIADTFRPLSDFKVEIIHKREVSN